MLRQILGLLLLAGVGIALLAGGIAGAHGWELLALITIGLLFCLGLAMLFFALKGGKGRDYCPLLLLQLLAPRQPGG